MINQGAQVSEADIQKHVTQVVCRKTGNCKNSEYRPACVRCSHNRMGLHLEDNYRPRIEGMKFF